jgi:hypothetical protein
MASAAAASGVKDYKVLGRIQIVLTGDLVPNAPDLPITIVSMSAIVPTISKYMRPHSVRVGVGERQAARS